MKRIYLVMMVAAVLICGLLLGAKKPAKKWEYAKLNHGRFSKWNWTAPGVFVDSKNVGELCEKLSIETPPNKANVFTLFDWAGSDGWELIVVVQPQEDIISCWFKRPK